MSTAFESAHRFQMARRSHQAFIVGPNCGWTYAEHALSDSKKFHTSAIFTHLEPGERLQLLERSFQFTTRPSAIQRRSTS